MARHRQRLPLDSAKWLNIHVHHCHCHCHCQRYRHRSLQHVQRTSGVIFCSHQSLQHDWTLFALSMRRISVHCLHLMVRPDWRIQHEQHLTTVLLAWLLVLWAEFPVVMLLQTLVLSQSPMSLSMMAHFPWSKRLSVVLFVQMQIEIHIKHYIHTDK